MGGACQPGPAQEVVKGPHTAGGQKRRPAGVCVEQMIPEFNF